MGVQSLGTSFYTSSIRGSKGATISPGAALPDQAGMGTGGKSCHSTEAVSAVKRETGDDVTAPLAFLPALISTTPLWWPRSDSSQSDSEAESYASCKS